ncbi:MAG: hypothetical protein U0165_01670 [Polyangiaceae bacterium]
MRTTLSCSLFGVLTALSVYACNPSDDPANTAGSAGTSGTAGTGGTGGTGGSSSSPIDPTPDELAAHELCPTPSGTGTEHSGTITEDETWTAAGSPHRVTFNLTILANVTIEPCAVVIVSPGMIIDVGSNTDVGKLIAHGSAQLVNGAREVKPVVFDAEDPATPWTQLAVRPKGTIDLSIAALLNGGAETTGEQGALLVNGVAGGTVDDVVTKSALIDRVLIQKSATYGINLEAWGTFADGSKDLWIRNSGSEKYPFPIRLEAGIASTLPQGLTATGNVKDEILISSSKTFMHDDTFVNRGLPYHQRGTLYVAGSQDGPDVTLTIEPGVTLGFETEVSSGMYIGSSDSRRGVLVAEGTQDAPVVFTSALDTKSAGDWMGLYFHAIPSSGNHITNARIEYAGAENGSSGFGCGPGDNDGAVFVHGWGPEEKAPDSAFIDHTTFDNIAGSTVIVSAWIDDSGPSFFETNTFGANTPDCKVSKPRRTGAGDVCDGDRTTCWNLLTNSLDARARASRLV